MEIRVLSEREQGRRPIGWRRAQHVEQEKLFRLMASLASCLDRYRITETLQGVLGVEPVEYADCVVFNDLGLRFDDDGRVSSIYRIIDGTGVGAGGE